jgi:predicted CoA-substrate-specific enzyme activase
MKKIGIDLGSTTIKIVVLDEDNNIIYKTYKRHFSHIKEKLYEEIKNLLDNNIIETEVLLAVSGSAGMGVCDLYNVPFVQEVYATRVAAEKLIPGVDTIIELGGEDAKILFLSNGLEVRMNGTCAGGTGAFIDQMATLLNKDITEINDLASRHTQLYSVASRCGVFAKSDIQPLLNQGASKADIAASIFYAVVNQTIGGLAQGWEIKGNVIYLGGPLTFMSELRKAFDDVLKVKGVCPENSLYFVSLGTAFCAEEAMNVIEFLEKLNKKDIEATYNYLEPLFKDDDEYKAFIERHEKAKIEIRNLDDYNGNLYLGIDSGSTTLKIVLIDENEEIRFTSYQPNKGNPIQAVKHVLKDLYEKYPNIKINASASTGYGEELIKNAFLLDASLVETMAHYTAAKKFMPDVSFIIDIGGQDIKCFKIDNQTISNVFLNEACSSGCGSFLQTFANALGYEIEEFSELGLKAQKPVDLGSRCTVFMNSSVKQAQKDGATIDNISAGLSISVVKNALYKVIRVTNKEQLGKKIVVQGGTFLNKAVLRSFEKELDVDVICPNIAGLMGAYGAALYAKTLEIVKSQTITKEQLADFKHDVSNITCNGCNNHCLLTVNSFKNNNNKFISGNKCEKPVNKNNRLKGKNLYEYIRNELDSYKPIKGQRGKIGIPLVLNLYELLPFWHTFFTNLGFEVHSSGFSDSHTYQQGQYSIPSDTVCYPAKLVHGHIEKLIKENHDVIFYPCMSYNFDEKMGDNHFNCPIVAYYPENITNNVEVLNKTNNIKFISDFILINDNKIFNEKIFKILNKYFEGITKKEVINASKLAYQEHQNFLQKIRDKGKEYIEEARKNNQRIIVLAGRPYHVDPQINHGIDKMIADFGICVITEESISHYNTKFPVNVLNQWTYHSRLYSAAKVCATSDDMNLVQLVSFGCGLDAVTTDECREIIESQGRIYTQIKIDEITNLGAVKIRIRSLLTALEQKRGR